MRQPCYNELVSPVEWTKSVVFTAYPQAMERLEPCLGHLRHAEIENTVCDSLKGAMDALLKAPGHSAVFIDAVTGMSEARLHDLISRLKDKLPLVAVVVLTKSPRASVVQTALRAGALDLLDLSREGEASIEACMTRIREFLKNVGEADSQKAVKAIFHKFMRSLVQTERSRMQLENKLQQTVDDRRAEMASVLDEDRAPVVLVVDDETALLDFLSKKLGDRGLTIHACRDCDSASKRVATMSGMSRALDVALVDINLPDGSGVDLAEELRRYAPHIAIFMMSGAATDELRKRASALKIAGFIKKPIKNLDSLAMLLQEHALSAMEQAREHHYLREIKSRHEELFDRLLGIGS